jgi:hypothetical protein
MRLFLFLIAAAVLGFLLVRFAFSVGQRPPRDVNAMLAEVTDSVNRGMPMMLDSATEITSSVALNHVLQFNYRLVRLDAATADRAALATTLEQRVRNGACTSHIFRDKLLKRGITVRFAYADSSYKTLFSFDLEPKDCGF